MDCDFYEFRASGGAAETVLSRLIQRKRLILTSSALTSFPWRRMAPLHATGLDRSVAATGTVNRWHQSSDSPFYAHVSGESDGIVLLSLISCEGYGSRQASFSALLTNDPGIFRA